MKQKLLAVAAICAVISGTAWAEEATDSKSDPNRIICKTEKPIGSNIPTRVCMTAAERDRQREQSQELMREVKRKTPAIGGSS